ncbi:MAG: ATP synthase gamma chain, partial [Candidatus Daviesbacteria bacterium GW2011_GWA1_38_7]
MQMVAATKMRRAQTQALGGRPYHGALSKALVKLLAQSKEEKHPLLSIK